MQRYVTFRDTDNEGELQYYILQRDFPHIVAKITTYPVENKLSYTQITGYYLWITLTGTLRGDFIPNYVNILEEIKFVIEDMSIWYYENRIIPNEKKYKKFKYDSSPN